jgi:hypothetical protein
VSAATYRASGASFKTIETVDIENPDCFAMSARVILPGSRLLRIESFASEFDCRSYSTIFKELDEDIL